MAPTGDPPNLQQQLCRPGAYLPEILGPCLAPSSAGRLHLPIASVMAIALELPEHLDLLPGLFVGIASASSGVPALRHTSAVHHSARVVVPT